MTDPHTLALPWYTPADFAVVRGLVADGLPDDFDRWLAEALEVEAASRQAGVDVTRVWVRPPQLLAWCRAHDVELTARAIARFARAGVNPESS